VAISFVDATSGTGAVASPTIDLPTGLAADDVLILCAATDTTHTAGAATGWTHILSQADGTDSTLSVWWRLATGSEGATEVVAMFAAGESCAYGCVAYRGVDTSAPINQQASADNGASGSISGPSVTPAVDNCMIIQIHGGDHTAGFSATPDASPVANERVDQINAGTGAYIYLQDYLQGTAAAIALDSTKSSSMDDASIQLALKPAAGGGGVTNHFLSALGAGT
jgi:hypothetical protein